MTETNRSTDEQTTILVVDDETMIRTTFSAVLTCFGYSVVESSNGLEALAVVARRPVAGILLDVMMPGMDGFEVCRRLRRDPATAHIPVVLVTALTGQDKRRQGLEAGADEFMTKPIDIDDLLQVIRRVIPGNRSLEQPVDTSDLQKAMR